jgi:hypothetical protein
MDRLTERFTSEQVDLQIVRLMTGGLRYLQMDLGMV